MLPSSAWDARTVSAPPIRLTGTAQGVYTIAVLSQWCLVFSQQRNLRSPSSLMHAALRTNKLSESRTHYRESSLFFLSPRIVIWSWALSSLHIYTSGNVYSNCVDCTAKRKKYEWHLIQVDLQSYHDSKMTSFCTLLRGYWKGWRRDQYTFLKRFKHPREKVPEVEWRLFGMFVYFIVNMN